MSIPLAEALLKKGLITGEQLELALKEREKTNRALGQILVERSFITEKQLLSVFSELHLIPFVEIKDMKIDEAVIKSVPAKFIRHYKIMPVGMREGALIIAMSDPFDIWGLDDLGTLLGMRVNKVLAVASDIEEAARKYYGVGAETVESLMSQETAEGKSPRQELHEGVQDLEKTADNASVLKLVSQLLQRAIDDRASDIHIERFRNDLFLRYRIDGILYDMQIPADIKYIYPNIVSRIKIMADMDIIERRLPQDGRAKVKIGNREYDLRISVIPTLFGENIVMRILPTDMLFNFSELGLSAQNREIVESLIQRPHGILFITGPTGSGKTTTLYSCLNRLNDRERKIITIEDPVEYELRGVSQIQINTHIDLTFAKALRSVLRHDPDIIMVGEVRDLETAEIAVQTALTGHLVFSTLHTNDAASGVTRLVDIGVEPFLVSSAVQAFIAQRLVRTVCSHCREPYDPKEATAEVREMCERQGAKTLFRGKGCAFCNKTGYSGRIGIYEILRIVPEIRKMILEKTPSEEVKNRACGLGMKTLQQDGWDKVIAGLTTVEEVLRVTQLENGE